MVLCARDGNLMEHAVKQIESDGGRAAALAVDLREMDAAKRVVDFTLETYGQIDISSTTRAPPSAAIFCS